jgi:Macro domain
VGWNWWQRNERLQTLSGLIGFPVEKAVVTAKFPSKLRPTPSKRSDHIKIVDGDLLDQDVEVIVNAWNRNVIPWWLLLPQGVSGAIKRRAGFQPFRELAKNGPIPLGGAVGTGAGKLPFKAIIHVRVGEKLP